MIPLYYLWILCEKSIVSNSCCILCGFSSAMVELTKAMCWELVNKTSKDAVNRVAVATFKKPTSNNCYEKRSQQEPPLCPESDDPNAAW